MSVPSRLILTRYQETLRALPVQRFINLINYVVLQQFSWKGLFNNDGVAVVARLVESVSNPISNEDIKKQREKRETQQLTAGSFTNAQNQKQLIVQVSI